MMKKFIAIILLLCLIISMSVFAGCGDKSLTAKEGEPANGFLWENNFSEITITGYQGASNDLQIPEKINGKPVTKIKDGVFSGFAALKSVKISKTCVDISGAFKGCAGLTTVVVDGVKNIDGAFAGCKALKKVTLKNGIESMKSAFSDCAELKSVSIPKTVTDMTSAFKNCGSLTEVELADGITNIDSAFVNCAVLESISVPNSVTNMDSTFSGCSKLKTFNIPTGVTSLNSTFSNCTAIVSVTIPSNVSQLTDTFFGCTSLVDVKFSDGSKISFGGEYGAFGNCTSLKALTIPDSVTILLSYGYNNLVNNCTSLEKLYITKSFETIKPDYDDGYEYDEEPESPQSVIVFNGVGSLKEITMPVEILPTETEYDSEWSLCTDSNESFYKDLMKKPSNWYWIESIEVGGTNYRRISNKTTDDSYYSHVVKTTEGLKNTEKTYYLAETTTGHKKAIICLTDITYPVVNMGEDYTSDTVLINGVEYPVYNSEY